MASPSGSSCSPACSPLGVLISWHVIDNRRKLFYVLFLLQQVAMLGIFVSLDLFLYYAFWELSLVPMALLIATFGRTENRRRAGIKFFLYAFIPSAILLVGMLWLYARTGTFDFPQLAQMAAAHDISSSPTALWLASLAFLVASSRSKFLSSCCTVGSLTPSPRLPPPQSWSSPESSDSTPSCASPSASSPASLTVSLR